MSRQITISMISALVFALVQTGAAQNGAPQTYSQLGMMSGSGQLFMPATSSSPNAQFRLQLGRIGLTSTPGHGINLITAIAGFSPFLEGYLKFTSEQVGSVQSIGTVGFGAKLTIPYMIPILHVVSLWGESSTTPADDLSELYSPGLSRGAIIVTPFSNGIRPSILLGATKDPEGIVRPMEGASVVMTAGNFTQWGIEYLHGYNGATTQHVVVSGVIRLLPYVSLNAGPGYISAPGVSSWIWSLGVSLNTSDIDFKPVEKTVKNKYKLPTIEEMEKGASEDQPESSEGKVNE